MKSIHLIPAITAVTASIFLQTSCAVSVRRNIKILERDSLCAQLFLPADNIDDDLFYQDSYSYVIDDSVSSDTLTIIGPEGEKVYFMKATVDSSGALHATEMLNEVVVTARFKNVAERNGMVRIAFDIRIPDRMINPHWQIRLCPKAIITEDTVDMEDVHVTGCEYREKQIRGYELYNNFLSSIITDSSKLIHSTLLERFIQRNIPLLAKLKEDSATVNPEMIKQGHTIDAMNSVLNSAELVIPDGVGIKIALKLKGINQERIAGIEFAKKIISMCANSGYKIALFGAKEEILQKTGENLMKEFPGLNIVYSRNGYFSKSEEQQIKEDIKNSVPDVVFTALGAPKQEIFNSEMRKILPQAVFIGIGGSFDVWSGVVQRAPVFWQKTGLEWLYRTVKEPQRFKRIFPTLPIFLIKVIIEVTKEKFCAK